MKFLKLVFIICIFLFSFNLVFSQDVYYINSTQTVEIDEHNVCHEVTNNGVFNLMVPTKSSFEWFDFINDSPSFVSFADCFDGDCLAAGGEVKDADGTKVCSFKPGVGGHNCTTLDCIFDIDTNSHIVAWKCPTNWTRLENWGSYNKECWAVDYSWNRCGGNWFKVQKGSGAWGSSGCDGAHRGMPSVWSSWSNNLAPSTQGRSNICTSWSADSFSSITGFNQFNGNTGVYGGAATADARGQVKTYSIMDSIGCVKDEPCDGNLSRYRGICREVYWNISGSWGECSRVCGDGFQTKNVQCILNETGEVIENKYCNHLSKEGFMKPCNLGECKLSCKSILDSGVSTSGVYPIDPDMGGPIEPRNVYCDMTTQGGGWALVVGIDASNSNHVNSNEVTPKNIGNINGKGKFNDDFINAIQNSGDKKLRLEIINHESPYYPAQGYIFTNCPFDADGHPVNQGSGCNIGSTYHSTVEYGLTVDYPNAYGFFYSSGSYGSNGVHEVWVSGQYRWKNGRLWAR